MKFDKIHNKGQAQIFRNKYLEYLTKTHPLVIWSMYLPVIIFLPYFAIATLHFSVGRILLIFCSGVFFWTFFEYIIHRFVFHFVAESPRARKISYVIHGNHHEFPRDSQRLFMPVVPSIILSSLIFLGMRLLTGTFAFAFFPGFLLGYLMYASAHFAIHAWHPPFKWLKPIWRNHHLHHYKDDEKGFGVSSHFWDIIFGTTFDLKAEKEDKEDKEAVRQLMFQKKELQNNLR